MRAMTSPPTTFDPAATALFLDIDGTLIDIADHPQAVSVGAPLLKSLETAAALLDGALALVSGRDLDDIDALFGAGRFAAAGAHGAELRTGDGERVDPPGKGLPDAARQRVDTFVDSDPGLLVEHKSAGLALHYRGAPALENDARALARILVEELGPDYRLIDGKMVLELAPSGHDKGAAIAAFLERKPWAGRQPIFVGDDVTDEDGFRVVNARDGIAVKVGGAGNSAARFRLADVADVHRWLARAFNPDETART